MKATQEEIDEFIHNAETIEGGHETVMMGVDALLITDAGKTPVWQDPDVLVDCITAYLEKYDEFEYLIKIRDNREDIVNSLIPYREFMKTLSKNMKNLLDKSMGGSDSSFPF